MARKMRSLVLCEAMAAKMVTTEMASTATASPASKCSRRSEGYNAGQNQTSK